MPNSKPNCSNPTPLLLTRPGKYDRISRATLPPSYQCVADTSDNSFKAEVASCKINKPTYTGTPYCSDRKQATINTDETLSSGNTYWLCAGTSRC